VWYDDDAEEVAAVSGEENGKEGDEDVVVVVVDPPDASLADSIRGTRTRILYERIILPLPGQSLPTDNSRQPSSPPNADGVMSLTRDESNASPPDGGAP
jgi:hypothetical protein